MKQAKRQRAKFMKGKATMRKKAATAAAKAQGIDEGAVSALSDRQQKIIEKEKAKTKNAKELSWQTATSKKNKNDNANAAKSKDEASPDAKKDE